MKLTEQRERLTVRNRRSQTQAGIERGAGLCVRVGGPERGCGSPGWARPLFVVFHFNNQRGKEHEQARRKGPVVTGGRAVLVSRPHRHLHPKVRRFSSLDAVKSNLMRP